MDTKDDETNGYFISALLKCLAREMPCFFHKPRLFVPERLKTHYSIFSSSSTTSRGTNKTRLNEKEAVSVEVRDIAVWDKATTRSVLKISWMIPRYSKSRLEGSYLILGLPCHGTEQWYRERRLILKESWGVHIRDGRLTMPLASLGQT